MGIIAFIILGLLAGLIAKAIMPGKDPGGYIVTTVIGVAGALIGGFLAAAIFGAHPLDEFFDISTWLTAIVGAVILLALYPVVIDRNDGRELKDSRSSSLPRTHEPCVGEQGSWVDQPARPPPTPYEEK